MPSKADFHPMFIDTHTLLFSDSFNEDRDEIVRKAISCGVEKLLLPNIDIETIDSSNRPLFYNSTMNSWADEDRQVIFSEGRRYLMK